MGGQRYTIEQLELLRDSPLVQKPEGLPSIEQWMDTPVEQNNNTNNNNRRARAVNNGETAPSAAERPLLINAGGNMGQFGRRPTGNQPEETVLGPPKLAFASARTTKAAENAEKRGGVALDGEQGDRLRRWGRDREGEGARDKERFANGRRGGREEGEGWTNVRGRKSLGQDDFDRDFGRTSDRDREKASKDGGVELGETPARRTGATARDRTAGWGRRDDATPKELERTKFTERGQGGWRERDRDRGADRERDWNRGGGKQEEDPEWMDTPSAKEKKQEIPKNTEDFAKWMEKMKGRQNPAEKEEPKADEVVTPSVQTGPATPAAKPFAGGLFSPPPGADAATNNFFTGWLKSVNENTTPTESAPKPAAPVKGSRFMPMFMKQEEPSPVSQPPMPSVASPAPQALGGNDNDAERFNHILQMLQASKGAHVPAAQAPPQQPQMMNPTNGANQGGVPLGLRHSPPSEEQPEARLPRQPVRRTAEQESMLQNILAPKASAPEQRASQARIATMSPDNPMLEQFSAPRPESTRSGNDAPFGQPPRTASVQDPLFQTLMNNRAQQDTNLDPAKQRQAEFLLNLMQQPTRATPPQLSTQNLPRPSGPPTLTSPPGPENPNMGFFDQAAPRQPPPYKGRGAGFMEDPRFMANENDMRRDQQMQEAALREQINRQQREQNMRAKNSNMPMGFNPPYDDPAIASLQRRNTAGELPRQMTNMGIPSQPVPDMGMYGGRNPGMPPTPNERPNIAPPPGFNMPPGMRQPPPGLPASMGMNGPQMGPSFSAGNTPLGHPPSFGLPPGNMRGMFPGGPGQSQGPPPPPPQGYFPSAPPPNWVPPMGGRGAEDPRMMMGRPDFDQFGPGPRQCGRPPNMY